MLKKIFTLATAFASFSGYAQDSSEVEKSKLLISGYVDVYYRYNLSNPKKDAGTFNNYTSFTNSHNSFEFNMASIKLEHAIGKVGMVADLGFGKRAEEFSYNDDKSKFAVKQAYVTYSPVANVKLTAGSWATHIGYEVVDPYLNRNYSMSYMFSKGPFFHTGIKADATLGKSGFMIGLADPSDLKSASFSRKFLIAQYSIASKNDKIKTYINYQGGSASSENKMHQFDVVITSALSQKFGIGYNGTVASFKSKTNGKFGEAADWWGSALYVTADPVSWFGLSLREEYFNDENRLTDVFQNATAGGKVIATTLSANFKIQNLTIIPEWRWDKANKEIFINSKDNTIKSTSSLLLAAVYHF